jgi:hypothetical protein
MPGSLGSPRPAAPELEAVPFRIRRPAEAAEFALVDPRFDENARGAELLEHRVEVADSVVDHRLRGPK